ncbi:MULTISPECIES: alanine racemase [Pseudonocardia]|uniref:D-threonine aldolase n=2 Tax=Pseudonocardia TaxID=1847 RepID=A0A1Y2MM97_PSEAH|nr:MULTISPECIES: alanine racemase [Pseudonocardia]OSY36383.1 D-threonine aldolase [Pseudonocardia autotrophica]TDN72661.1 D-serine deaminase-like pyridoxal phosphate-dependent protein [Pseudonocardia autotrophica]BBG03374.1 alanine racemase [Pseudonocardia autotrophica]GEC27271.1 alanine racemase [Pseudonocardia saturnea]
MRVADLTTPALLVEAGALEANLADMAAVLPGPRLRPHVKAHKTTALAARQLAHGHQGFTCATVREVEGMAAAGLGADLLLANEVLDARRLGAVVDSGARVTLAIDSEATLRAAVDGGIREVLVDVNIGLPRCGIAPDRAGALADAARAAGLRVRGVMGYEGHLQMLADQAERARLTTECTDRLLAAHADVGGEVISGGGTGTHTMNTACTEIQAGSYALMDTAYTAAGLTFRQSLTVLSTVVSATPPAGDMPGWAVADAGLKAFGMDHGNPTVPGADVWFCSDEHLTFTATPLPRPGDRIRIVPAHVDPTVALHERMHVVDGDGPDAEVLDSWPVDLRGW